MFMKFLSLLTSTGQDVTFCREDAWRKRRRERNQPHWMHTRCQVTYLHRLLCHWPSKITVVSNLQIKKLRPREFKSNLLNVSVSEQQSWDLNPGLLGPISGNVLFNTPNYFPWVLFKYLNRKALNAATWLHGHGRHFPSGETSKQFVQKSQGKGFIFSSVWLWDHNNRMCFVQWFLYIG